MSRQKPLKEPAVGHPFPIREIARQAGLSEATVDRVLNGHEPLGGARYREVRMAEGVLPPR